MEVTHEDLRMMMFAAVQAVSNIGGGAPISLLNQNVPFRDASPKVPDRLVVGNTRIDLAEVVNFYNEGIHPDNIRNRYDSVLQPYHVYQTIGFYLKNREVVDHYVRCWMLLEQVNVAHT